ncbi:MAG TPA: CoA transferase [Candidatus Binatia bacterium]|nr:CoA transferase [Candidatus Binatia bacterium]
MARPTQIFAGIRILDFTQWLAGPQATRLLVDLGAEVIKVELPPKGEHSRNIRIVPKDGKDGATPSYFVMHNRGKKSLCVDVKTPEGQGVIKDLVKVSDVLFENFTPGIMAHYGLTYDVVSQINPRVIMCSVSTYGQTGPYAQRIGNDLVALAAGGVLHMMGEPDGYPAYPGSAIGDHMGALNAFGSICAALFHRERTGEGQYIDLALVDCAYNAHDWALAAYSVTNGEVDPQRGGTQRTGAFPYGAFKSKDGYIAIGLITDAHWEAMVKKMGHEELLASPEFKTNRWRIQNADALRVIIEEWLQTLPSDEEAIRILADELRLPAAPILSVGQFARNPHLGARMIEKTPSPDYGELLLLKSPHNFSKTPPRIPGPASRLGQHNEELLRDLCGYSAEKIRALREKGVLVEDKRAKG